jgi:Complex I intermediate-associated protein 30 (CIA30)
MIYRYFVPRDGGGWVRRYLNYRRAIMSVDNTWIVPSDRGMPSPPLPLFDFARIDDAADARRVSGNDTGKASHETNNAKTVANNADNSWQVSDDSVIGGYSFSTAKLVEKNGSNHSKEGSIPFLRWEGMLDTTVGLHSTAQRSGFSAIRSPHFPFGGANLRGLYNALELKLRIPTATVKTADGTHVTDRVFTVNLKVSTYIPNDIYQGFIQKQETAMIGSADDDNVDHDEFDTFVLPFRDFQLTAFGRQRALNRALDDNVTIQHIGFTLMDGQTGPFVFDIRSIRAVNLLPDGRVFDGQSPSS